MATLLQLVTMVTALTTVAGQSGPVFDYSYPNFVVDNLGESVTLNCSYYSNPDYAEPDGRWINARIKLMDFNTGSYPGYTLENNGWMLRVDSLKREDIGFWHCLMFNSVNQTQFLRRIGLNAQGPFFEDLWKKYQRNVTIGLGAGAGFAVFAIVCCLAWQFRWEKRQRMRAVTDAGIKDSKSPVIEMGPLPTKSSVPEPKVDTTAFVVTSSPARAGSAKGTEPGKVNAAFEVTPEDAVQKLEPAQSEAKKPSPPPSYVESEEAVNKPISNDTSAPSGSEPAPSTTTNTTITTTTTTEPKNTNNNALATADVHV